MGVEIPPPHFVAFPLILACATAWSGTVFGSIMWLLVWSKAGMSGMSAIGISYGTGLFFGLCMGMYYAYGRRKYSLPDWASL